MRFATDLAEEELLRLSRESFPRFHTQPGLQQKYYVRDAATGLVGGVYLFDDEQAARDYVAGPIVAAVPHRFQVVGDVSVEVLEVTLTLN
ncbi:YdhR family protein [Microbacterium capsulatum]|uniref:YdhR family protein n=1 Tax=Microbacterium capsulatum TaxID=3041921 RepID=A0ABU0XFY1_9MICO|nr:YdhR family protein [Microbacterium sp. ASV81]MDQ4214017.1 YdhR family protein [Microbacterium sp. ASV81]